MFHETAYLPRMMTLQLKMKKPAEVKANPRACRRSMKGYCNRKKKLSDEKGLINTMSEYVPISRK
jgi:hypothetical protein